MAFTMLSHIESCKVEAKELYLANQSGELSARHIQFTVCQQAVSNQQKISEHFFRGVVGNGGIRGSHSPDSPDGSCGFQALPHEGELAAIRFLSGLGAKLPIVVRQTRGIAFEGFLQLLSD